LLAARAVLDLLALNALDLGADARLAAGRCACGRDAAFVGRLI
jgi:hypothetical protein